MVSRVLYRPFDTEDFDAIALILQQLWHNNSDNDEYNRLEAACDLAYCLSSSTFSQVAVIDGEARGIALARAGQSSGATVKEHWMDTERALLSQMRELEPDACAEYLSFVRATIRTNNRLLESSPLPHDNEVTLLAVDPDVHGLGVGSVLLDAAVSYLSSRGATRAHLYTDSNCSWKFYELHGFKRTATGALGALIPEEQRTLSGETPPRPKSGLARARAPWPRSPTSASASRGLRRPWRPISSPSAATSACLTGRSSLSGRLIRPGVPEPARRSNTRSVLASIYFSPFWAIALRYLRGRFRGFLPVLTADGTDSLIIAQRVSATARDVGRPTYPPARWS